MPRSCLAPSILLLGSLFVVTTPEFAHGDETKPKIGDTVADITFKDIRYLPRRLGDFGEKRAYVIVAVNTTCPVVQKYLPKLRRLDEQFRDRDVQFIALNTSSADSIMQMAEQAIEFDVPFAFVKDVDGSCVQALGLSRTPEVVVLDHERQLKYRGRIDDQYRVGATAPQVRDDNLATAIEAVLSGLEIAKSETPVDGCLITAPGNKAATKNLTFSEHIAPLVRTHCSECHRPGTEAPFSLLTYQDVSAHGQMIAEVVADQRMPPWYGASENEHFVNARSMSDDERATIRDWVASGMAAGDETAAITPVESANTLAVADGDWLIGTPDRVITMRETHELPAEGIIPYHYAILPFVFPHDTWLEGVQILPDNPGVVHHCNIGVMPLGKDWDSATFLTGKVPGSEPLSLRDGIAARIPKGSMFLLQIHYTSTGKPEKCRISVGVRHARYLVKKELRHKLMASHTFEIPPGAPHHPVSESVTIDTETTGIGLFSHMHVRGKDMTFLAHLPDGNTEKLLTVPNYSFDWQMGYRWAPDARKFPAGTRFETVAHFDNSPFNPFNPDPKATVREGQQTYEEMMYGFYFYTEDREDLNLKVDPATGAGSPIQP